MAERNSDDSSVRPPETIRDGTAVGSETGLSALLRRELERCRWGWEAGAVDALVDALQKCEEHNLPLTDWMHKALAKVIAEYEATTRRSHSRRRRMADVRDYARYDLVVSLLESLCAWKREAQELRKILAKPDAPGLSHVEAKRRRKHVEQLLERLESLIKGGGPGPTIGFSRLQRTSSPEIVGTVGSQPRQ